MTQNSSVGTKRFSIDSERHGLLGRVIENWLINVNERQYQLPFCQVLAAEGETILYISSHGPFEKGKDIITRAANGEIRAYQLKAGDIKVGAWRNILGEIVNLVELAIELPGLPIVIDFVPYLVTNGEVSDAVMEQVRVSNLSWLGRGFKNSLRVVQKGELFERFRTSHGAYLPHEMEDFRTFLELVLRDGTAPAEKAKAAQLIEHVLPKNPEAENSLTVSRAAASIVLLTAYITGPTYAASNHWSAFELWVLAGAYVLYLIERSGRTNSGCEVSFDICEMAAEAALRGLSKECATSNLIQGFPLVEGHVYRARVTIIAGLLSSLNLSLRLRGRLHRDVDFATTFLGKHLKDAAIWGESGVPYLFLAALEIEQNCRPRAAEGIVLQLLREISAANGPCAIGRGIPNSYYSAEEALRLTYSLDFLNQEQFVGQSYCIESLVEFLARRWRRQALAALWFGLTRISLVSYVPGNPSEWFRWKSTEGLSDSHWVGEPQSWKVLRESAETRSVDGLPPTLIERPTFAVWFVLVYPHRFTPTVAKFIEDALWRTAGEKGDRPEAITPSKRPGKGASARTQKKQIARSLSPRAAAANSSE